MRTLSTCLALAVLAACESSEAPIDRPVPGWRLTFSDEFEGPVGALPDATKWTFDVGGNGWGNAQLEHNTDRADNASLDGAGNLVLTARRERYQGNDFTSARMKTQGLFAQRHGRFEARIKLPAGAGLWPAFWLLGDNITEVGWPKCGEIDIMEFRGQIPDQVVGSVHGPGYSGGQAITDGLFLPEGQRFSDDFHVFAVEWDKTRIAWFVDDTLYHVVTPSALPGGAAWAFEHPFFIILNLAVGGNFVGSPSPSTPFPAEVKVDWVRVWEREP